MTLNTKLKPLNDAVDKLVSKVSAFDRRQQLCFMALIAFRGLNFLKVNFEEDEDGAVKDFVTNTFGPAWDVIEANVAKLLNPEIKEATLQQLSFETGKFFEQNSATLGPQGALAPISLLMCLGLCSDKKLAKKQIEIVLKMATVGIREVFDSENSSDEEDLKAIQECIENEYNAYQAAINKVTEFCPKNCLELLNIDEFRKLGEAVVADLFEDE